MIIIIIIAYCIKNNDQTRENIFTYIKYVYSSLLFFPVCKKGSLDTIL